MAVPIVAFLGARLYRTQTEQQGKKSFPQSKQRTFRHKPCWCRRAEFSPFPLLYRPTWPLSKLATKRRRTESNSCRFSLPPNSLTTHQLASETNVSMAGKQEAIQKRDWGRLIAISPKPNFGPASKSAIKCRIRSALTQAEAAVAIATSLHR